MTFEIASGLVEDIFALEQKALPIASRLNSFFTHPLLRFIIYRLIEI